MGGECFASQRNEVLNNNAKVCQKIENSKFFCLSKNITIYCDIF